MKLNTSLKTKAPIGIGEKISKTKIEKNREKALADLKSRFDGKITLVGDYKGKGAVSTFKCEDHGYFRTKWNKLNNGWTYLCPNCGIEAKATYGKNQKNETWTKIKEQIKKEGILKITKESVYISTNTRIKVKCIKHNTNCYINPNSYCSKRYIRKRLKRGFDTGCLLCVKEWNKKTGKGQRETTEEYMDRLHSVQKGKVALVGKYKGAKIPCRYKCINCGHEWKTSGEVLVRRKKGKAKHGCPKCNNGQPVSTEETKLFNWVKTLYPDAISSYRDKKILGRKELDIYIPSKKIAIEYNGIYWHRGLKRYRHYEKWKACKDHGITLISICSVDWNHNKKVVKKTLRYLLGKCSKRVYARKLKLVIYQKLTKDIKQFYKENHIQGPPRYGVTYTLQNDSKIMAAMTFCLIQSERGKTKDHGIELIRFACDGSVPGAASRLFKNFIVNTKPKRIISYSMNDWFTGGVYVKLGFRKVKEVKPDYSSVFVHNKQYVKKHKSFTRKQHLQKLLGKQYDPNLTEKENCMNNGITFYYDCGKTKWEYPIATTDEIKRFTK